MTPIPTNRLSPKNQVTLPRDAPALRGEPTRIRALPAWMPGKSDRSVRSPVALLMTGDELRRRERRIIEAAELSPEDKQVLVQELNAGAAELAIDDQRRVVLPPHLIEHLALAREIMFVATGDLIYAWNPDTYRRWSAAVPAAGAPDLGRFILV